MHVVSGTQLSFYVVLQNGWVAFNFLYKFMEECYICKDLSEEVNLAKSFVLHMPRFFAR